MGINYFFFSKLAKAFKLNVTLLLGLQKKQKMAQNGTCENMHDKLLIVEKERFDFVISFQLSH